MTIPRGWTILGLTLAAWLLAFGVIWTLVWIVNVLLS